MNIHAQHWDSLSSLSLSLPLPLPLSVRLLKGNSQLAGLEFQISFKWIWDFSVRACRYTAFDLCCVCLYTIWWLVLMDRKREMMFTVPPHGLLSCQPACAATLDDDDDDQRNDEGTKCLWSFAAPVGSQNVNLYVAPRLRRSLQIFSRSPSDTHAHTDTLHRTAALTTLQTCLRFLLRCENARFFRVK